MVGIRKEAAINGFGRFGLGLFRAWYENRSSAGYDITCINDDVLTLSDIITILKTDPIVTDFHRLNIFNEYETLCIRDLNGHETRINVSRAALNSVPWLGVPDLLFECSGISRSKAKCRSLLVDNTETILIGATTEVADATLIMNYNHEEYRKSEHQIISFGSCTVIPGVHMFAFMKKEFEASQCHVNIVHSVPKWQLDSGKWTTIARKTCSLERVAPKLIPGVRPADIKVNYTYAPYYGVSSMDFDFSIKHGLKTSDFRARLLKEIRKGSLQNIVTTVAHDAGAGAHLTSRFSIVVIEESVDIREDRIFFFGYFNNEGSGIRLHELAKFIVEQNVDAGPKRKRMARD